MPTLNEMDETREHKGKLNGYKLQVLFLIFQITVIKMNAFFVNSRPLDLVYV